MSGPANGPMNRPIRGMSLLELLVAVALFAVVGALAWGGLQSMAQARAVLAEEGDALRALQASLGQWERDLRQAAPRPARDGNGERLPALAGAPDGVEFTRLLGHGGWERPGPPLERIGWRCRDGRLQRLRWSAVDRAPQSGVLVEDLLEDVVDCRFTYRDGRRSLPRWPSEGGDLSRLPTAVELAFRHRGAEYRRLLRLPDAPREAGP